MSEIIIVLVVLPIGFAFGLGTHFLISTRRGMNRLQQAEREAQKMTEAAAARTQKMEQEAKEQIRLEQDEAEKSSRRRRKEIEREEETLQRRRTALDERLEKLEKREATLNKQQSAIDRRHNESEVLWNQRREELERVAGLTREEARNELMVMVETESRTEMARRIRMVEEEIQLEADNRARNIISLAIQRMASETVSEVSVSVVPLPSDEMKGRIIGRAGRNIRAFEQATGVDVIVDDTPEAVTISSFDPVRREVARRAMAKLVSDGRIHPARIEKLVEDARSEVEQTVREEGERAAYETSVHGLHPEILKLLGRLKFRYSYGQNQHAHAIETAHIAGMIAAELGADVQVAKAAGLLHDIGKAIDHEVEGTHAILGAEFVKRYAASLN